MSEEQSGRKDIKFVFELPKTLEEVKELLTKRDEEEKLIILMRVRDFYNPILEPKYSDAFKQFIVCLLTYYVKND